MQPTVGIDFHIKNVTRNGRQFRIQLWDTAGQERFRSLIPNYMKDANCAVMVYDITKRQTLENLKVWNEMFEQHQTPDAIKVFVGNKTDLADREVARKDGES
jgi:small GTP-binding protein